MPSEISKPPGTPPSEERRPEGSTDPERTRPTPPAPPAAPLTTSGDELSAFLAASLVEAKPDPLLGEFVAEDPGSPQAESEPAPALRWPPEVPAVGGAAGEPLPVADGDERRTEAETTAANTAPEQAEPIPDVAVNPAPVGAAEAILFTTSEADVSPPLPENVAPARVTEYAAPTSADELDALASIANPAPIDVRPPNEHSGSVDAFPAFDLSPPGRGAASGPPPSATKKDDEFDDEFDEEDDAPRWMAWIVPLLLSYASAVTIGLVWVLYTGRSLREKSDDFLPPTDTRADPGKHALDSKKIEPPKPIPGDHYATLGKPIHLGQIEVTPLQISSGRVMLQRTFNPSERKDGGPNALKMKVRFRNVSKDTILYPFDEAFVREREREVLDSYIETGKDEPIAMYPLAVSSEWKIVGQEFPELKPGKSFETEVVSAPDSLAQASSEMTWRLRVRVDVNETDVVGVRFRSSDVKKGR